jgi:hypothetical protein
MATHSYLDLSTGHLRREDISLAESSSAAATRVVPHQYGVWIAVPEDDDEDENRRSTTPSLQACLEFARQANCSWINFDSDGDREAELPFYDW